MRSEFNELVNTPRMWRSSFPHFRPIEPISAFDILHPMVVDRRCRLESAARTVLWSLKLINSCSCSREMLNISQPSVAYENI